MFPVDNPGKALRYNFWVSQTATADVSDDITNNPGMPIYQAGDLSYFYPETLL